MKEKKYGHAVYSLAYHIVFVTKYRRPVLTGEIAETLKSECRRLIEEMGGELLEIETDRDHAHLLAELSPKRSITEQITVLKGVTARTLRKEYGDILKQQLWKDALWSGSYYIATAGGTTIEKLKQYVQSQQTEEHYRKYGKRKRGRPRTKQQANSSTT